MRWVGEEISQHILCMTQALSPGEEGGGVRKPKKWQLDFIQRTS